MTDELRLAMGEAVKAAEYINMKVLEQLSW
jgi:hypothetical protein